MRKSGEKPCTKCHVPKPLSEFNKQADSPDGHKYMCRSCQRAQERKYASITYLRKKQQRLQHAVVQQAPQKQQQLTATSFLCQLIEENMPQLRQRATHIHWKYLGGLASCGAEDLLQDTLEDLLCSKKDLEVASADNLYGLFYLRCTQKATNRYRREKMHARHAELYLHEPSLEETEDDKLIRKEFADAVVRYLTPVQQEILHKRAESKRRVDIAQELNITLQAVEYHYAKAKRTLKTALATSEYRNP